MDYHTVANSLLSSQERDRFAKQLAPKLILLGVVLVVVSTLYPFKFSFSGVASLQAIFQEFRSGSSVLDVLANVILFMPLGFGLASAIARRRYTFFTQLLAISLLCGGFSLSIEVLQIFLPGRKPTLLDILANGAGGGVGFLCFHYVGTILFSAANFVNRLTRRGLAKLSLNQLISGLIIYALVAGSLVVLWQSASLRGWDTNLPLVIGNNNSFYHRQLKREVSTAWNGTIADVMFSDRDLSRDQVKTFFSNPQAFIQSNSSLLAAYALRGEDGMKDLLGQAPSLTSQGTSSPTFTQNGVTLSKNQWLQSTQPIKSITESIRSTSTFTISALIEATHTSEKIPSAQQIISIAFPSARGNLSISQFQSNLQVVLTYSRTTRGQRFYQQLFPNVFTDNKPHRLLLTYSGFVLRVYVDGIERVFITDIAPNRFQIMFYLLILFPLGLLITLVANRLKQRLWIYLILIGGGTILPALLLEGFWATVGDRNIRISNLLLGMLIVGGTILASQGNPLRNFKMKPRPSL